MINFLVHYATITFKSKLILEVGKMAEINIVKRLPVNKAGRDFVVGDLHGCRSLIDQLMTHVKFDGAIDRLFLVGDLADRGPDSIACLKLLENPWCHAVMGNHEELLIGGTWRYIHPGTPLPKFFYSGSLDDVEGDLISNGGSWVLDHLPVTDDFFNLIELVRNLPQILVVGEDEDRFNIVHAELPLSYTDQIIDNLPKSTNINEFDFPYYRWSRSIMGDYIDQSPENKEGLSKTYTGHTIGHSIRRADSHVCLDTGGYKSYQKDKYSLTMIEPATGLIYTIKPNQSVEMFYSLVTCFDGKVKTITVQEPTDYNMHIGDLFTFHGATGVVLGMGEAINVSGCQPDSSNSKAKCLWIQLDHQPYPDFLYPNETNQIQIVHFNEDEDINKDEDINELAIALVS